ncbi:hypothetical protein C8R44DRAFT_973936 [Mycena epipterygia]|nr:hypothetical protein C8R44DRAFT_973936 [Mycena epipterygia]
MAVVFTDNGGIEWKDDHKHGVWSSLRRLSSPATVRTETWERTRLRLCRAVEILKDIKAEALQSIASILQDISVWNPAVIAKVNELALNLVELYVVLLISMAPEVQNLPPDVFERLAGILTRVRELLERRSRLSLVQRSIRRKQFREDITVQRTALIDILTPFSNSITIRRNFIVESQVKLDESSTSVDQHRRTSRTTSASTTSTPEPSNSGLHKMHVTFKMPQVPSPLMESPPGLQHSESKISGEAVRSPEWRTSSLSTTSHSPIIYLPPSTATGTSLTNNGLAVSAEDSETLDTEFADGGLLVSVHPPQDAVSWLEAHYDDPLLQSLRSRNFHGPVAVQLSAEESALAIFGSIADALDPDMAKALAEVSGFAVMIRSAVDNPIPRFTHEAVGDTKGPQSISGEHKVARLRGGASETEDDDEPQMTPDWVGPAHNSTLNLTLKMDDDTTSDVNICSYMQFKTQSRKTSVFPPQPDVACSVSLEVKLRREEIILDRSYSNIGLLVHRPHSIVKCDFMDYGYEPPEIRFKHMNHESRAITGSGSVGLASGKPTLMSGVSYTRDSSKMVERADEKSMPKCHIRFDVGKSWEKDEAKRAGKDFQSYDVAWFPASDRDNVPHEMQVDFGLGMAMHPDKNGLPGISAVLRHQIMLWVHDPKLRSKARGVLLLISTYIPNALTNECLTAQESVTANVNIPWDLGKFEFVYMLMYRR